MPLTDEYIQCTQCGEWFPKKEEQKDEKFVCVFCSGASDDQR